MLQAVHDSGGRFGMTGELQELTSGRVLGIHISRFLSISEYAGTKSRFVLTYAASRSTSSQPFLPPCLEKGASYVSTLRSIPSVPMTPVLADIAGKAPPSPPLPASSSPK